MLKNTIKAMIFILILAFSINLVNAGMVEKPLNISVANCFNITIEADLNNGKETDLQFNGCSKIDNNHFICNCYNSNNNNFSIIMQSDNYPVRDLREYDFKIKATYFNFNSKSISVPVTDSDNIKINYMNRADK